MSILLASTATTHSSSTLSTALQAAEWLIWIVWAVVGLVVARLLGAFNIRSVAGPVRLSPESSAFDLLIVLFISLAAEIAGAVLIMHHTQMAASMQELIAGMVGKAFNILAIVLALGFCKVLSVRSMGLPIQRIGSGVAAGAATLFILYPLVQLTSNLTMLVYQTWHFKIPDPHPVLQKMGETQSFKIKLLGFVLAAILAPLAEELFFRGLLQTALSRCMAWMAYEFTSSGLGGKPRFSAIDSPRIGSRWAAIVLTAAIFAVFHVEPAVMPALFVLAVGLGYAYERTGNLWVTITAHSLFNAAQILLYLAMRS